MNNIGLRDLQQVWQYMFCQIMAASTNIFQCYPFVQGTKKMGNQGTRFLRKVCESEEGWDETPIFYLISSKFKSFGPVIQVKAC